MHIGRVEDKLPVVAMIDYTTLLCIVDTHVCALLYTSIQDRNDSELEGFTIQVPVKSLESWTQRWLRFISGSENNFCIHACTIYKSCYVTLCYINSWYCFIWHYIILYYVLYHIMLNHTVTYSIILNICNMLWYHVI